MRHGNSSCPADVQKPISGSFLMPQSSIFDFTPIIFGKSPIPEVGAEMITNDSGVVDHGVSF
jgi:hypothetical protein